MQTRTVCGLKMPVVVLPRFGHQLRIVLARLSAADQEAVLRHPSTLAFARRVPFLDGRHVVRDARDQPVSGVMDIAATPDPRYPVWCPIDRAQLQRYLDGDADPELAAELVLQVALLLTAAHSNLLAVAEPTGGDQNAAVAAEARELLMVLVERLMDRSVGPVE
jgi:hypothetical protein